MCARTLQDEIVNDIVLVLGESDISRMYDDDVHCNKFSSHCSYT